MPFLGEIAAVMASLCFSMDATLVTYAGRKLGAVLVNRTSVTFSMIFLALLNWATTGQIFPVGVEPERWLLLGVSGIFGYWLAFLLIVSSFLYIGPRLGLLVASVGPIITSILAWIFLGEVLDGIDMLGIAVTMAGIVFVISARGENGMSQSGHDYKRGVIFALSGSLVRAISLVLSKPGLSGDFPVITGSLMRVSFAVVIIFLYALIRGEFKSGIQRLRDDPRAFRQVSAASLLGPTAGAVFIMLAVQHAEVGIASTLGNLMPIFLIPISYFVFKERITPRAVVGTIIAFIGTAILFIA